MDPPNPYAPPAPALAAGVAATAPLDEAALGRLVERHSVATGKIPTTQWELAFHEERFVATRGDGARAVLSRAEVVADTDLLIGIFLRALVVRAPTRLSVPLPGPPLAALRRFVEPVLDDHLAASLRRRLRLAAPIGVLVVITSLPSVGLGPLDVGGLVFGGGLLVLTLAAKIRKHRVLFLLDAVLWLVLAANNASHFGRGGSPWMYGLFAALGVLFAIGSAKLFAFYGPLSPASSAEGRG